MFFLLAILATIFYSLNNVFLAPHVRKISPLLVNSYRGLSLGITMLPLVLILVPYTEFAKFNYEIAALIVFTSLVTVAGNVSNYKAQIYLPVGVATALCLAFSTLVAILIGVYFLNEEITPFQVLLTVFMLVEIFLMGIAKSKDFKEQNIPKGLLYSGLFGIFLGTGFSLVGVISKAINPVLVGYLWEFGIGILGLIIYLFLGLIRKLKLQINFREFYKVGLASSPTIFGTSCYAFATTLGPISILAAIIATVAVFTALFGYVILKERLSTTQWVVIIALVVTLAGLRLAGT
jgi:drug/metabolite transporter (DMT)-like permease